MSEQLFHVGIKAVVQNEHGELLLVGAHGQGQDAPRLDLPGGRMEANETFLQTLDRELREEIGVTYTGEPKLIATTLAQIQIADPHGARALVLVAYSVTLAEGPIVLGDEEEVYAWLSPSEAADKLRFKYDVAFCEQIVALGQVG